MREHKQLFQSAGTIGFFTLISRILGFIRDVIIARLFGTSAAAQAFVVAFRIPNMLRDFAGEGAANAAVIPVLSGYLAGKSGAGRRAPPGSRDAVLPAGDNKEFWHIANVVLSIFTIVLCLITILGIISAPVIVRIIAFGFVDDPEKLRLTIRLTRIMFSFILFMGISAYLMGILNTLKHFTLPAMGSCFFNITVIVFGVWIVGKFSEPIIGLAAAVLTGGFLQLIVQLPVLFKKGFQFRFSLDLRHPAVKKIGALLVPRMIGSSAYQISIFVDTMFASLGKIVGEGAVAALYYANRLVQFPTAIFGIAVATACLPTMSRQAVENDLERLKETLIFSLRSLMIVLVPAAVGLGVLAVPVTKILFQRGEFDAYSTQLTALALVFYCLGIFAYSAARVTTSCFYSLKDTKTPLRVTVFSLALNVIFNIILMFPLRIGGLALSTSICANVNFILLLLLLRKKIGPLGLRRLVKAFVPVTIAASIMGIICRVSYLLLPGTLHTGISLLATITIGIVVFLLIGWNSGIFREFYFRHEVIREN